MPAEVIVYSTDYCPYCYRAKSLLSKKKIPFIEVNVEDRPDLRSWLITASGQRTVPQIFVNGRAIGGFSDMAELEHQKKLDPLLAQSKPAGAPILPQ